METAASVKATPASPGRVLRKSTAWLLCCLGSTSSSSKQRPGTQGGLSDDCDLSLPEMRPHFHDGDPTTQRAVLQEVWGIDDGADIRNASQTPAIGVTLVATARVFSQSVWEETLISAHPFFIMIAGSVEPQHTSSRVHSTTTEGYAIMTILDDKRCRWLSGDDRKAYRQCPTPISRRDVYCNTHKRRAFRPRTEPEL